MARIGKAEYPTILRLVDVEQRKVALVAADYGCTPAAIYAVLSKLRRAGRGEGSADTAPVLAQDQAPTDDQPATPPLDQPEIPVVSDLFAAVVPVIARPAAVAAVPARQERPVVAGVARGPATVTDLPPRKSAASRGGLGAALAKPGYGLTIRTAEGDESMTPFRSLDDLLSAVKPILRAAARSPDAIWFSIQPIDLSALDSDAA